MLHVNAVRCLIAGFAAVSAIQPTNGMAQANMAQIVGRVLTPDGAPAAGAEVRVLTLGRRARVDEQGRFAFAGVPVGEYLLEAHSVRFGHASRRVTASGETAVEITLMLQPAVHLDQIVITGAAPARQTETFQATSVVTRQEIVLQGESSLGETLSREPGINSTYFGPGASRPIIRGLGGDRVRLLESGVDVGDASSTSPDHAVSVEPTSAERIEIIRGPATLLYGSSAIGGVVNVIDNRIPSGRPIRPLSGQLQGLATTAADEFHGAGTFEVAGGPLVLHLSGLRRNTDDYSIPGFGDLTIQRGQQDPGTEQPGTLENSAVETTQGTVGLSLVGSAGFVGASFSGLDTEYGVPGEDVSIALRQRRADVEGGWRVAHPFLHGVKARFGITDYGHRELEGTVVGTEFLNNLWETRLEAEHGLGLLSGVFGTQFGSRDFSAIGEEAFVPPTVTNRWAVFLVEELDLGRTALQIGARYERQNAREEAGGLDLSHSGFSASGGVRVTPADEVTLALSISRSVKVPNAEELFSNGPHAATLQFEIGDPTLGEEAAIGVDAAVRVQAGPVTGELAGFVTRFDDFIFQASTPDEMDGLPVFQYMQQDALFTGFEAQADLELFHRALHHVALELWGDYVRAELTPTDEPLPRIPPLRVGTGVRYEGHPVSVRVGVRRVTQQDRVAMFEEATPGYTMLDAAATYRFFTRNVMHELIIRGTNLTDEDARNHVSFLKEVAPLPGRDLRFMYRLSF